MNPKAILVLFVTAGAFLAGCTDDDAATPGGERGYADLGYRGLDAAGTDKSQWPDLRGEKVVVLDHGAFDAAFGPAKEAFEALTNGTVEHVAALDAGDALARAIRERGDPSFDVVYGIDNVLLSRAIAAGALMPYTPLLASRVNASYVFFGAASPWPATPVDHGYIAVNVDARANLTIRNFYDLRAHADEFVTEDPRTSTPGLGFLLATVATFGEGDGFYDWRDYWGDLFDGGVLVTSGWTEAYVQHFSGGYGAPAAGGNGLADRPIVTSYTTSPAYEQFYGATQLNQVLTAPNAVFHQIETMAIANGTRHLAAAQAWIEFTLTDRFQDLQAEYNAIYPVVDNRDVARIYGHLDPRPGSFEEARFSYADLGANVERWVKEWTALYEKNRA